MLCTPSVNLSTLLVSLLLPSNSLFDTKEALEGRFPPEADKNKKYLFFMDDDEIKEPLDDDEMLDPLEDGAINDFRFDEETDDDPESRFS